MSNSKPAAAAATATAAVAVADRDGVVSAVRGMGEGAVAVEVELGGARAAEAHNLFVTMQMRVGAPDARAGPKARTEVSSASKTPAFTRGRFVLGVPAASADTSLAAAEAKVAVELFAVVKADPKKKDAKASAKLFGSCLLPLAALERELRDGRAVRRQVPVKRRGPSGVVTAASLSCVFRLWRAPGAGRPASATGREGAWAADVALPPALAGLRADVFPAADEDAAAALAAHVLAARGEWPAAPATSAAWKSGGTVPGGPPAVAVFFSAGGEEGGGKTAAVAVLGGDGGASTKASVLWVGAEAESDERGEASVAVAWSPPPAAEEPAPKEEQGGEAPAATAPVRPPAATTPAPAAARRRASGAAAAAAPAQPPLAAAAAAAAAAATTTDDVDADGDSAARRLAEHAEALQACGVEIVSLRKQVRRSAEEAEVLRRRLRRQREQDGEQMEKLDRLGEEDVKRMLVRYVEAYNEERSARKKAEKRAGELAAEAQGRRRAEQALAGLQEAHMAQAAYIQKLQARMERDAAKQRGRADKYRHTITQQEQVIAKLEEMLTGTAGDPLDDAQLGLVAAEGDEAAGAAGAAAGGLGSTVASLGPGPTAEELEAMAPERRARVLEARLRRQQDLNRRLATQLQAHRYLLRGSAAPGAAAGATAAAAARSPPASPAHSGGVTSPAVVERLERAERESAEWRLRAEQSEERILALEEELDEASRRAARQVSELKIRLREKEMEMMGGFGSSLRMTTAAEGGARGAASSRRSRGERPASSSRVGTRLEPLSTART